MAPSFHPSANEITRAQEIIGNDRTNNRNSVRISDGQPDLELHPMSQDQTLDTETSGSTEHANIPQLDGPGGFPSFVQNPFKFFPAVPPPSRTVPRQSIPAPARPPVRSATDLLPWCTAFGRLSEEQVIALSDLAGSLKELMMLSLRAANDDNIRFAMENALGPQAARGVIDFWAEEWVAGV